MHSPGKGEGRRYREEKKNLAYWQIVSTAELHVEMYLMTEENVWGVELSWQDK